MQTQTDKDRKLREWLEAIQPGIYLYDLEEQAFGEMSYAEFCQFQEWEREYDTVGDVLEMIHNRDSLK